MKSKGKGSHKMPCGKVMKGASHMAEGGSVNMNSDQVSQHKRMAAGYNVKTGSGNTPK